MKGRWIYLLFSVISFFVGIVLLLLFMHLFTVPHVLTSEFLPTTCVIAKILVKGVTSCDPGVSADAGVIVTNLTAMADEGYNPADCPPQTGPSDRVCVEVRVAYTDQMGETVKDALAFMDSWNYYQVTSGITKCACTDCRVSSDDGVVDTGSGRFDLGDTNVQCLYNPYKPPEVLLGRTSTVLVLNAMLWPTLLFIIGFVGIFFGCLFVQHDRCNFML